MSATVVDPFFSAGPGLDEALLSFEVWRERMLGSPGLLEHEPHLRAVHASFGALGRRGLDWDAARRSTADGASQVASTIAATAVLAATGGLGAPLVLSVGAAAGAAAWGSVLGRVAVEGITEVDLPEAAYDYARGGFEGALEGLTGGLLHGLGGAAKAGTAANLLDEGVEATISLNKVMRATVELTETAGRAAFEGMTEGVVGGLGGAVFETAMDRHTWSQSLYETFSAFLWRATLMSAMGLGGGAVGGLVGGLAFGVARAAGRTTPTSGDVWDAYEIALAAKKSGTDHILYQASPEQHAAVVEGLQRMQKARRALAEATATGDEAAIAKAEIAYGGERDAVQRQLQGAAFTAADALAMLDGILEIVEVNGLQRAARELGELTELFSEVAGKELTEVFEGVKLTVLPEATSLQSQLPTGLKLDEDTRAFLKVTDNGADKAPAIEVLVDAEASSTVLREELLHVLDIKYGRLDDGKWTRALWKELTWEKISAWGEASLSEKRDALYARAVLEQRNADHVVRAYGERAAEELSTEQLVALEDARLRSKEYEGLAEELDALKGKSDAEIRSGMEGLGIDPDVVPVLTALMQFEIFSPKGRLIGRFKRGESLEILSSKKTRDLYGGNTIVLSPDRTTTVLGTLSDTTTVAKRGFDAAGRLTGVTLNGENRGAVSLLRSPVWGELQAKYQHLRRPGNEGEFWSVVCDEFWTSENKPWLEEAIRRNDSIRIVSDPSMKTNVFQLNDAGEFLVNEEGEMVRRIFGLEVELLSDHGYIIGADGVATKAE